MSGAEQSSASRSRGAAGFFPLSATSEPSNDEAGWVTGNAAAPAARRSISSVGSPWLYSFTEFTAILLSSIVANYCFDSMFGGFESVTTATAIGLISGFLFASGMHVLDSASPLRSLGGGRALRDVTLMWGGVVLAVLFLSFALADADTLSRGSVFGFVVLAFVAIVCVRVLSPPLHALSRAEGINLLVLSVPNCPAASTLIHELRYLGNHAITHLKIGPDSKEMEWRASLRFTVGNICSVMRRTADMDICIVAAGFPDYRLSDLVGALRVIPRAVHVVPSARDSELLRHPLRQIGRLYAVEIQKSQMSPLQRTGKRIVDILISVPLLIFIAPLLFAIALAIKIDSRGPVFFAQRRTGYLGEHFRILKFRTMSVLEDGETVTQACKDDQRVTRFGKWLRTTSLDELPQLWNVIVGQMSLVGPRPHALAHDAYYSDHVENYEIRQHVKPGITGWAQVNGLRGATESVVLMHERIQHDIWYARNASLSLDIRIIAKTAFVLLLGQENAF
jgi:putative colanic acid biosynthesis UDP-glucose lipid carrier transferase